MSTAHEVMARQAGRRLIISCKYEKDNCVCTSHYADMDEFFALKPKETVFGGRMEWYQIRDLADMCHTTARIRVSQNGIIFYHMDQRMFHDYINYNSGLVTFLTVPDGDWSNYEYKERIPQVAMES